MKRLDFRITSVRLVLLERETLIPLTVNWAFWASCNRVLKPSPAEVGVKHGVVYAGLRGGENQLIGNNRGFEVTAFRLCGGVDVGDDIALCVCAVDRDGCAFGCVMKGGASRIAGFVQTQEIGCARY